MGWFGGEELFLTDKDLRRDQNFLRCVLGLELARVFCHFFAGLFIG